MFTTSIQQPLEVADIQPEPPEPKDWMWHGKNYVVLIYFDRHHYYVKGYREVFNDLILDYQSSFLKLKEALTTKDKLIEHG